ncbi:hypothetical protein CFOL_v3_34132 [Cephalotus follicularis]|uniref:CCG-binding protein 1 n=1 Tax=Cephalotus follicularis TaxID=3775 RepID=A0A1Q3DEQ8_CEPFO|nr:hypothetical protein CFOL_v3_34132 [Cephalotus follicularis]
MIKSSLLRSCSTSPLLFEAKDLHRTTRRRRTRLGSMVSCCSTRNKACIPKLEPFSRTKFERMVKEPPLIQKCEEELSDYCTVLEGEDSYSCWKAYFELKDLEKESPKADVERLILQAGGLKSLIGCLHGVAAFRKGKNDGSALSKRLSPEKEGIKPYPIPDGLPKSAQELEEEERAMMPESPYTRMLRTKGRFPAWYSQAPDHETD